MIKILTEGEAPENKPLLEALLKECGYEPASSENNAGEVTLNPGNPDMLAEVVRKVLKDEHHYRLLLEGLQTGVVIHAPDTCVIFSNPEASRLLGLTQDQMQGKTTVDPAWCFRREDGTRMPTEEYPVNQVIGTLKPQRGRIFGIERRAGAEVCWVQLNAYPEFGDCGQLKQVVATFSDITERKQAEEQLKQKMSDLERFNALTVDRELRMTELKQEVNALLEQGGGQPKYRSVE